MATHQCPSCKASYKDILDHIRKKHPTTPFTTLQLQPVGLVPCPECGTACRSAHGAAAHMAKIHGITGAHRISTGLRIRTQPPGSATPAPRANTFSPDLQAIQKLPTQPESPRHTLHQSPQADQDSSSRSHGLQGSLRAPSAQRKRRRSISPDQRAVRAQFTDPEATEALRARLLLPVRPPETPCNYCAAEAALGHEDLCRGASRRWLARHNQITRAFEKTLTSRPDLEFELEPHIPGQAPEAPVPQAPPRADFAVTLGNTRYFYDVQIVAINKQSARTEAAATLQEAAAEKQRKYKGLGHCFKPLIVSAGGLMEKETAQTYKGLQRLIGSVAAAWLDSQISYTLVKTRAISAASIARDIPLRN